MPSTVFRVDEIGEAIVDLIRDNLVSTLSLKLYRQGGTSDVESAESLDSILNAAVVMFNGWGGCEPGPIQQCTTLTYRYTIWLIRRNNDGENSDREMGKALAKIGALFPNAFWIGGADEVAPGLAVVSAIPKNCDAANPLGFSNKPPCRFSSGSIDVEVEAIHSPI